MLNLLFMHYFFYFNGYVEWIWSYSEIINLFGVTFDVSIVLLFSLSVFGGRLKPALLTTFVLTLVWAFVNVEYGRFFYQYISLSAIGEAHALSNNLVMDSVLAGFKWYDLFFVAFLVCFISIYRNTTNSIVSKRLVLWMLAIPFVSILMTLIVYFAFHIIHPKYRNNWELLQFRTREFILDPIGGGTPNLACFQNGCVRVVAYELYTMMHVTELSEVQRKEIVAYYSDHSNRFTHHQQLQNVQNVIIILMESFLSDPRDLKVDGKEITPFLNQLKRDSDVYYNGNMVSDIGCGESGDGQFIYMNGILPLHSQMTVGQVKNHTLPALPKVLSEYCNIKHSEIIYPTMPTLWQQADMNKVYGFTESYSMEDIVGNQNNPIDDEKIFSFAANRLAAHPKPFFALILSVSTHSPYNHFVGENLYLNDESLSENYKNYLNTCHYLDKQLCHYFSHLKENCLYDNSLIVICSDHNAHLNRLDMNGRISNHTPLFIINGKIKLKEAWNGEFHQLDVYTTVLDLLGVDSSWKGLGYSLLIPDYSSSVCKEAAKISDLIIEGDFFRY